MLPQDPVAGGTSETDRLFEILYPELRQIAQRHLKQEREDHTLQPTSLVHEAYVRLSGSAGPYWRDRVHFLAVASRVMRHVLVDHARSRRRSKRRGRHLHVSLDQALLVSAVRDGHPDLLAIDLALTRLERDEPQKAQVVEMRFFGGMTEDEIAQALGVTSRTVRRYWAYAQAWLYRDLTGTDD